MPFHRSGPRAAALGSFLKNLNRGIVTKTAKSVYQNHGYMNITEAPKINSANKAL